VQRSALSATKYTDINSATARLTFKKKWRQGRNKHLVFYMSIKKQLNFPPLFFVETKLLTACSSSSSSNTDILCTSTNIKQQQHDFNSSRYQAGVAQISRTSTDQAVAQIRDLQKHRTIYANTRKSWVQSNFSNKTTRKAMGVITELFQTKRNEKPWV
jgi:hypothetical protein